MQMQDRDGKNTLLETLKIWALYIAVIGLGLSGISAMIIIAESPASLIVGEWKEQSWEYEMVNKADAQQIHYKEISDEVKELIGENLVIHSAETWKFLPNGKLRLKSNDSTTMINWKLNGRGHILELKQPGTKESYNVSQLTDSTMVINFETDLEARGIAKLTFKRIKKSHDLTIQQ